MDRKISINEIHRYFISMQKGEYISCTVMQKGVDLGIDILSPAGKKVQTFDSPNGAAGPEQVSIVANETGKYELHIYPMNEQPDMIDSASKAQFAHQNQGLYAIVDILKLSVEGYKNKLEKEAADKRVFTKWLTTNSHAIKTVDAGNGFDDLQPFKKLVKDVTVVGLGESSHGTSEFFRMKHRMLEFLVNDMGFNSFYLEASMTRCRYINDYVLFGKGNLDTATVIQGFVTWRVEEVRNLIEWVRIHNKSVTEDKKVKFFGYDLQGNDYGWKNIKQFYNLVNPSMNKFIDSLFTQTTNAASLSNATSLKEQQDGAMLFSAVYKSCLELLNDINLKQGEYEFVSDSKTYEQNLMNIKLIIEEIESYKDGLSDRRDYYMAQNIMWLLNKEKKGAKVIVWAHNDHIGRMHLPGYNAMGYYLGQYLKDKYYPIGFEFYEGSFKTRNYDLNNQTRNWDTVTIGAPPVESLPWYFNQTGKEKLFIDFRNTGAMKIELFNQSFNMHSFGSYYSPKYGSIVSPYYLSNFDGMFYFKNSTPAKNFPDINLK